LHPLRARSARLSRLSSLLTSCSRSPGPAATGQGSDACLDTKALSGVRAPRGFSGFKFDCVKELRAKQFRQAPPPQ